MKELSNYELCLLIFLCCKQKEKKFCGGLPSRKEEYIKIWTALKDTIDDYCKDTVIKVIEPSNENSILRTPLSIQVENEALLKKFLDDYSKCLAQDSLDSLYDGLNFTKLAQEFKKSIDKDKKLTEYYIDATIYIPIILWGIRNEYIKVKEMRFLLFPNEETRNRMSKVELKRRKYGYNDFEFCMTADLSEFMSINIKKHRYENGNDGKPEKDFILEPQDWKMYLCICYAIDTKLYEEHIEGIYTINRNIFLLRKIYTDKSEAKARSLFNKRVRNNIEKRKNKNIILKLNKDNSKYDVDIMLFNEFTNKIKCTPHLQKGIKDNSNFQNLINYDYQKFTNSKTL